MNILIHVDELFLKGSNQSFFYNTLLDNLRALFSNCSIKRIESGIWLEKEQNLSDDDLLRLSLMPGIANFAIAKTSKLDIPSIKEVIDHFFGDGINAKTFRVSSNRSNKGFPMTSIEIGKELGSYVSEKYGLGVDLTNFDLNIHVDILNREAIVYTDPTDGIGGLPSGCSGKVLTLLSGGIDSPVAAYLMMVRGATVELIHAHNQTSATDAVSEKIFDLAKQLSRYQASIKLHMISFGEIQRNIVMNIPSDYRMIINRRIFFRLASKVARKNRAKAIVSGDSLGQVASQTLENINCVYSVDNMLKLSPLIGMNKREITKIARKIGTLAISERPYEDCCSMFMAKHPQTKAKLDDVLAIEKNLNLSILDKVEIKSYNFSMNNN